MENVVEQNSLSTLSSLAPLKCSSSCVSNTIQMGNYVLMSTFLGKKLTRLVKIDATGFTFMRKDKINLRSIIGDEWGCLYSLDRSDHTLYKVEFTQEQLRALANVGSVFGDLNPDDDSKDNRSINDDGLSQKLNRDEIEDLKKRAISAIDIVKSLVENSATFKEKNTFSQEKYLKKKQAKYTNLIRIQRPTPSLIAEMFYLCGPMKINNLRVDTLAQMLSLCNIHSSGKYIVVDTNLGLVTAAIVDRLVGDGSMLQQGYDPGCCIQVYLDDGPMTSWRQSVDALNLSPEALEICLTSISLRRIPSIETVNKIGTDSEKHAQLISSQASPLIDEDGETNEDPGPSEAKRRKLEEKANRRALRKKEEKKALEILSKRDIDGIIIVTTNYEPHSILDRLYPYLSPSQPYVVFSLTTDSLLKCYQNLRGSSISAKISETWMRHFQVLPSRTRPVNNMSGSSGFLLSGIKVISDP
ncbi:tRNA methyltransferase 6 non-catalytic subunit [Brevipalpus obovatus]|uniref:tRNA methyltransferase 6 non-catalytic subunit n=1 Tax=Brevipalpus obovatus TaxID=246614 RepID=UPI003D9DFF3B